VADAALVATLRRNIGDVGLPPSYDDDELGALLDTANGSEPRARVAALLPLWAEAAGRTDYSIGTASEKASGAFAMLKQLLDQAQAEAAADDATAAGSAQATAYGSVAIPVQFVF